MDRFGRNPNSDEIYVINKRGPAHFSCEGPIDTMGRLTKTAIKERADKKRAYIDPTSDEFIASRIMQTLQEIENGAPLYSDRQNRRVYQAAQPVNQYTRRHEGDSRVSRYSREKNHIRFRGPDGRTRTTADLRYEDDYSG